MIEAIINLFCLYFFIRNDLRQLQKNNLSHQNADISPSIVGFIIKGLMADLYIISDWLIHFCIIKIQIINTYHYHQSNFHIRMQQKQNVIYQQPEFRFSHNTSFDFKIMTPKKNISKEAKQIIHSIVIKEGGEGPLSKKLSTYCFQGMQGRQLSELSAEQIFFIYKNIQLWSIFSFDKPRNLSGQQCLLKSIGHIGFLNMKQLKLKQLQLDSIQAIGWLNCPNLIVLDLTSNCINEFRPLSKTNLRNLQYIDLSDNPLKESSIDIFYLTKLDRSQFYHLFIFNLSSPNGNNHKKGSPISGKLMKSEANNIEFLKTGSPLCQQKIKPTLKRRFVSR